MILVGSQRGGARDLAQHLMKAENEHVEVFEVRGFASDTLNGALGEAYALSRAGRCRKFLFSLSVNPPENAKVATNSFVDAIDRAEKALGLEGQPRAIVFHEKKGRRHAHAVWSRIKPDTLTAVHLPHTKRKLVSLTRDLFIEHRWRLPSGLLDAAKRDPRNFSLAEWQQAQRQGKDPRAIKTALQDAWASSDSQAAFASALKERGFWLARGDRRGYVVLDHQLEVYALPKWLGLKTGHVRERLGVCASLPSVNETRAQIGQEMGCALDRISGELDEAQRQRNSIFERRRETLVARQKAERATLRDRQAHRLGEEAAQRQSRFRKGLSGLWDRLRGEHGRIRELNEQEAEAGLVRDQNERDTLISRHLGERTRIDILRHRLARRFGQVRERLELDRSGYAPTPSMDQ